MIDIQNMQEIIPESQEINSPWFIVVRLFDILSKQLEQKDRIILQLVKQSQQMPPMPEGSEGMDWTNLIGMLGKIGEVVKQDQDPEIIQPGGNVRQ